MKKQWNLVGILCDQLRKIRKKELES